MYGNAGTTLTVQAVPNLSNYGFFSLSHPPQMMMKTAWELGNRLISVILALLSTAVYYVHTYVPSTQNIVTEIDRSLAYRT